MAPNSETITVSAPTEKQIATYPREFALFRQLDHSHKGQIPLKVGTDACMHAWLQQSDGVSRQ